MIPQKWAWLDTELADERPFFAGDRFSFADIEGMTALMIADAFKMETPETRLHVRRWAAKNATTIQMGRLDGCHSCDICVGDADDRFGVSSLEYPHRVRRILAKQKRSRLLEGQSHTTGTHRQLVEK